MAATYEPIASQTLGSATNTISFSSIPATYTDLRLFLSGLGTTTNQQINIRFNGTDATSTAYSQTQLFGTGSVASSNRLASQNLTRLGNVISTRVGQYSADIMSYSSTAVFKTFIMDSLDADGPVVVRSVGLYRSTSAISSMSIFVNSGNFAAGFTAALYGIKAA